MSGREDSYTPIHNVDLAPFEKKANGLLARIRWTPEISEDERKALAQKGWPDSALRATSVETPLPEEFKILDNDALILSQSTNTVLEVLRDGVAIGLYVQDDVAKRIGLETLEQSDKLRGGGMSSEVRHRSVLLSAIQLYCMTYYTLWHLRDFQMDSRSAMSRPFPGVAELANDISFGEQGSSYRSVLNYYAQLINPENGLVSGREELIDATVKYFEAVMEKLKDYIIPSLLESQLFADVRYSLEGSGFTIQGFEVEYGGAKTETVEIKRVLFSSIIGNHVPRERLIRAIKLMYLRDKETGENPAMKYSGIPDVFFAQGKPGAGKTLLASAIATMSMDLSKQTGLKVEVMIYPRNIVSKYQGVSGDRAIAFWKKTKNQDVITIVIMDEAEELIPDRDNDQASSGAKAGTNAFLVATEGSDQINTGIRLIFVATNHAHRCDPAALSRAKEKVEVNGAETANDYMDFINLMISMQDDAFKKILSLEHPKNYTFMADQENPPTSEELKDESQIINGLDNILAAVKEKHSNNQFDFYGQLFYQFQRANPGFSLRDLRNIIEATIFSLSQYDIPDSFFDPDKPDYFPRPLAEKEEILHKLLTEHLRTTNVNFADKFLENAIRQMREIEKVEQIAHNREVEATIKRMKVNSDAGERARSMGIV